MSDEPRAIGLAEAPHYLWGGDCDGWHFLRLPDLSVIRERMPPGRSETKHYHAQARQFFYVLSGEALLEFDGHSVRCAAGHGVHVPPGMPHRFVNSSSEAIEFLVISAPSSAGDRIAVATG